MATQTAAAERKAARQAERRERILEAARRVVQEHGAAGLTVTAVARAAHLSPPAIYYWFHDMHALTEVVAEEMLSEAMRVMVSAVARAESGLTALEAMMRAMVEHYGDHPEAFQLLHDNIANTGISDGFRERVVYPRTMRLNGALEALLMADQARGAINADIDVRALTHVAWCTALGILSSTTTLARLGGTNALSQGALLQEAIAHLHRGARP
ncbi:MAG: TetR/AcrR family transcriptional regulator [Myxococcota bacterium]|nr:TetR/AcrR family transcriptional regulator [Myxococcota bacterium]